jgi:hypothetical protein
MVNHQTKASSIFLPNDGCVSVQITTASISKREMSNTKHEKQQTGKSRNGFSFLMIRWRSDDTPLSQ